MRTILVVDDNPAVAAALDLLFALREIRVLAAGSPAEGLALLESTPLDLVIADMNFSTDTTSGEEGVQLFRSIRARFPDLPVILLTAWTSLESAVKLVKAGAADYLGKPWDDAKLLTTAENLIELHEVSRERERARQERRRRRDALEREYDLRELVFASESMQRTVELACRVARAAVPVLVTGPNGVGKERIAEILHVNSRVPGRLVAINCGALPPELIEAELFGAEEGAFTGANRAREGRFELADGGTLFLDEIGNLPLSGQVKLLRVLETGQFERLGSSRTRTVKTRVISATNGDLRALIQAGQFREDLYYRLNVIEISLAPLADRADDILPLAEHFLGPDAQLTDDARQALLAHPWPGNVRELRNAIERAKLLSNDGVVRDADLNLPALRQPVCNPEELDRPTIEAALRAAGGAVSRAAQQLGLSRQALYRRMERIGMRA
jgi:DNA-binding NtrC family response regulator